MRPERLIECSDTQIDDTQDFVAREIWPSTRKLLLASPRYLKARGVPRRIDDLARHDRIATRAHDGFSSWTLVQGRRKRRFTFAPRFYVSEFAAAQRAVLADVGIALLPESPCGEEIAKKRLVRVLPGVEGEPGGVNILYRAQRSLTLAVRTLVTQFLTDLPSSDPRRPLRE
jgi:DNA-binding transcriptional LysR family regulator